MPLARNNNYYCLPVLNDSKAIIGQFSIFQRQNSNIWLISLIKTDIFDLWSTRH